MSQLTLPEWYNEDLDVGCQPVRRRSALTPARRALAAICEAVARLLVASPCVDSWLGRIEPRSKIVGMLILIVTCTMLHSLLPVFAVLCLALVLAISVRMPLRSLCYLWLGAPLLSLAIIAPAATNLVTSGETVATLWDFGQDLRIGSYVLPQVLALTDNGILIALRFLTRSLACVTLSYLIIATTDAAVLFNGLRGLGMPRAFGMVLMMMQRYLVVILRVAEEIHLAKLSRTINACSVKNEQKWVAAGVGMLFQRTHKLADEVQNAMISRGYDGDIQVNTCSAMRWPDALWLCLVISISILLVYLGK